MSRFVKKLSLGANLLARVLEEWRDRFLAVVTGFWRSFRQGCDALVVLVAAVVSSIGRNGLVLAWHASC